MLDHAQCHGGAVSPSLPSGALEARRAPRVPALWPWSENPREWRRKRAAVRAAEANARRALMVASDDPHAESLNQWAEQVKPFDLDDVPPALRGAPDVTHELVSTPFAFRDGAPTTQPPALPPEQSTSYRPRHIRDILIPAAITKINRWLQRWARDASRNRHFSMPDGLSPTEQETYLKKWRKVRDPLILGQSYFRKEARGVVWDLRSKHPDGYYEPLQFHRPLCTHLDTEFLSRFMANSRDRDMVDQLCHTGVRFDADVPMQIVLLPHLISLPVGYSKVDKELHRLADAGCDYVDIITWLPFLPNRSIMQGAVARKWEPLRPRRISDAGAWRGILVDEDKVAYLSLNAAIDAKRVMDGPYPYENDTISTAGKLECGQPRLSRRPHTKLPPEIKPALVDVLHDIALLRYIGQAFKLELFILTDDFKDFFNQFSLASFEQWKVGFPWVREADADTETFCWIAEKTLGFGYTSASNFAQRVAWAIVDEIARLMDEQDAEFWANTDDMTDEQRSLVRIRSQLSRDTGRQQLRLFSVQHMYTDDPVMLVLGGKRLRRLLRIWSDFVKLSGFRMAIAAKRQIGSAVLWNGITLSGTLGAAIIPRPKVARACADLARVRDGAIEMYFHEYRSLCGLLEHLLPWAGQERDMMFAWYDVHKQVGDLGPTTFVSTFVSDEIRASAARWLEVLAYRPGILCNEVFDLASNDNYCTNGGQTWYMYIDAALEPEYGGLGGYCHGAGWYVPLEVDDRVGPYKLPITVLEYVCYFATLVIQCPRVPDDDSNDILLASDSLGSVYALTDMRSKSSLMQLVTTRIRDCAEFNAVVHKLSVKHVYGSGNVFADAESRGRRDVVENLAKQLGVEYSALVVPQRVLDLLAEIRARHRTLVTIAGKRQRTPSETEQARGKRHSSNNSGDGPSSDDERPPVPRRRLSSPEAPGRRVAPRESASPSAAPARSSPTQRRHVAQPATSPERVSRHPTPGQAAAVNRGRSTQPAAATPPRQPSRSQRPARARSAPPSPAPPVASSPPPRRYGAPTTDVIPEISAQNPAISNLTSQATSGYAVGSPDVLRTPERASSARAPRARAPASAPAWHSPPRSPPAPRARTEPGRRLTPSEVSPSAPPAPRRFPTPVSSGAAAPSSTPRSSDLSAAAQGKRRAAAVPTGGVDSNGRELDESQQHARLHTMLNNFVDDGSEWALVPTNPAALAVLAARGDAYAASGVPDGTIGVDKAGWRKWKRFLSEHFAGTNNAPANPWRKDPAVLRGDAAAVNREVTLLALFYIWVFASIRPRGRGRKRGKPQSALNVVAAVRRIQRRCGYPMPPCPLLAIMLKGMNDEYVMLHGDRRMLLPDRKEPLSNDHTARMLKVPDGTELSPSLTVEWRSPAWVIFVAMMLTMRMTGWRKADALSMRGSLHIYDVTRDDLSWYIRVNGEYRVVNQLPRGYTLLDGDCAVVAPGGSKNDRDAQTFGTNPMYIPHMSRDPNSAPMALQRMEADVPCPVDRRTSWPLFSFADGAPFGPAQADDMFANLACFALGQAIASTLSLHSCRVFLACALLATGADDALIQAMARWKTPESCHIYGRLNAQQYAQHLRDASTAITTSQQVTNIPQIDDDHAHVTLSVVVEQLETSVVEDTCAPPTDSEAEDADDSDDAGGGDDAADATARQPPPRAARRPSVAPAARIRVQQENPKRPGSKSHARFELYKSAKTKGEYLALGGTSGDFTYDVDQGFVVLE